MDDVEVVLKPKQTASIEAIISKRDTICNLPVGYGKSIIFHMLPKKLRESNQPDVVIVVCPLTTLMTDQLERLKKIGIKAMLVGVNGQTETNTIKDGYDNNNKKFSIIFGHPEGLLQTKEGINLMHELSGKVGAIVVDECHKIDDWGKEFRKAFSEIGSLRAFFPSAPVACLSATLTTSQISLIERSLDLKNVCVVSEAPSLGHITFSKLLKQNRNILSMEDIIKQEVHSLKEKGSEYPVTLLFMSLELMSFSMRYASSVLESNLYDSKFGCIYSNQDTTVMSVILEDLRKEVPRFRLVFTTAVIGMGFDSPSITKVIHTKPTRSLTDYFQEVGRVGRRGQKSEAVLHYCKSDLKPNLPGLKSDIVEYCNTDMCLRENILKNFGFSKCDTDPSGCTCCSNCMKCCNCEDCILCRHMEECNP